MWPTIVIRRLQLCAPLFILSYLHNEPSLYALPASRWTLYCSFIQVNRLPAKREFLTERKIPLLSCFLYYPTTDQAGIIRLEFLTVSNDFRLAILMFWILAIYYFKNGLKRFWGYCLRIYMYRDANFCMFGIFWLKIRVIFISNFTGFSKKISFLRKDKNINIF